VRIMVEKVLPAAGQPKQTLEGRRKRFSGALEDTLNALGWFMIGTSHYIYRRRDRCPS
jgi:hypothetical protein